jgi:predicted PurR-regulated permease PerM
MLIEAESYSLLTPLSIVWLFLMIITITFLSVFIIWYFDKSKISSKLFKKFYRTLLSYVVFCCLFIFTVFVGVKASDAVKTKAINVITNATDVYLSESNNICFTYNDKNYTISSSFFDNIEFNSKGTAIYDGKNLIIGE